MIEKRIQINEKIGFHARTSALFSKLAGKFDSDIQVKFNGKAVNGKSMLAIMTLGVKSGNYFTVSAEGPDEENAIIKLLTLVEGDFKID